MSAATLSAAKDTHGANNPGVVAAPFKENPMTTQALRIHDDTAPRSNAMTPMDMVQQAVTSGANIDVLEKLLALQERWEANQGRKDFDEAIAAAKADIKPVARNKTGHNGKRYADFAAYAREVDPILAAHGLSYRFRTEQDDRIKVTCVLSHRGGHSETNTLAGPADSSGSKNAIQAIGSTLTYLQRYTLTQALGLAASDDDDARTAEDPPISGAAEAAINSIADCTTLDDLTAWKEKNDPTVNRLDRNDADAVVRAWKDRARAIRSGAAQ
jgi:hypothetical protein